MCLTIAKRYKPGEIIIEKCIKKLYKGGKDDLYTPFCNMRVPITGILAEEDNPTPSNVVYGGHIHAYISDRRLDNNPNEIKAIAYAINVKAYGRSGDLVCKFLYIPLADLTGNKEKTRKKLDRIIKNPSWDKIRQLFPDHQYSFPSSHIKIDWESVLNTYNENNIHEYYHKFLEQQMSPKKFIRRFRLAWRAKQSTLLQQ